MNTRHVGEHLHLWAQVPYALLLFDVSDKHHVPGIRSNEAKHIRKVATEANLCWKVCITIGNHMATFRLLSLIEVVEGGGSCRRGRPERMCGSAWQGFYNGFMIFMGFETIIL